MKILVMSDSHNERSVIENLKNNYKDEISAIFHCGDSELPSNDKVWEGVTVVSGNCDYDTGYKEILIQRVGEKKVLLTHGHLQGINTYGLTRLSYLAEQKNADIVLFGHIHRPVVEMIDNCLFINPGSIAQPRGEWNIKMYAVVEWEVQKAKTLYKISYRDLNHQLIPKLQFTLEATHK